VSEALRQAALRRLTSELASRRFWARIPDRGFPDNPVDAAAIVDAMLAIGALSGEEAATWRSRFGRATTPPQPEPTLRAHALEHLGTLRDRGDSADGVDRLSAALTAFVGVDLLTPQERKGWRGEGKEAGPRLSGLRVDLGEWQASFDDSVFRRVLLGPVRRVAGLRVTAVELYAGAVMVHWHYCATAGENPDADALWSRIATDTFDDDGFDQDFGDELDDEEWFDRDEPFQLADDMGTRYSFSTGGIARPGDGVRTATGQSGFAPGVPARASRLKVVVENETLPVELD
jgi:hypothetical protein